jgi:anti-sigma regulatory factor (Ser/Thr protein kinase)
MLPDGQLGDHRVEDSESRTRPRGRSPTLTRTNSRPRGAIVIETLDRSNAACWELPDDLSVTGETRHKVTDILTTWGVGDLMDDVILVVGELLANAVTYGEPPIRLALSSRSDELRVQVTDHGTDQPRELDLGIDATHGRGLAIVAALAGDHGVTRPPDGPGKTVWARWRFSTENSQAAHAATNMSIPRHRHRTTQGDPFDLPPWTVRGWQEVVTGRQLAAVHSSGPRAVNASELFLQAQIHSPPEKRKRNDELHYLPGQLQPFRRHHLGLVLAHCGHHVGQLLPHRRHHLGLRRTDKPVRRRTPYLERQLKVSLLHSQ